MPTIKIPFGETGFFSPIILDYLSQKNDLQPFYGHFPKLENFGKQMELKTFDDQNRLILSAALRRQYAHLSPSLATIANITALENPNTYTVTTGHQLNLFTGPLYFLLKIIDTILLSQRLADKYPGQYFVPVYWMATEDHDFEEIASFNFRNKKFAWDHPSGGPVGRLDTDGLVAVFRQFEQSLGPGTNAERIRSLFSEAYLKHDNLADATRFLANELFGTYGLVIVDGDDRELKKVFAPFASREVETGFSFDLVTKTTENLGYPAQVHAREINLFYIRDGLRQRIVRQDDGYAVVDTHIRFSHGQIMEELSAFPERFSPNVILRPLYQELVLPNLAYVGGGGEIAYWLQLKEMFAAAGIPFPILMLRDSAMIASEKQDRRRAALGLEWAELFLPDEMLSALMARKHSVLELDFTPQRLALEKQFSDMLNIAEKTHPSFLNAVRAQQVRQLKGLANLEKKLLRAEKKNLSELVDRALELKAELFPGGNLQERKSNFSEFFLQHGDAFIEKLMHKLDPLDPAFRVVIP